MYFLQVYALLNMHTCENIYITSYALSNLCVLFSAVYDLRGMVCPASCVAV